MRNLIVAAMVLAACRSEPTATAAPQKGSAMSTDFKPNIAFRTYAAKALGIAVADIDGGAIDAATAAKMPNSLGGAWAYTVWQKSNQQNDVRGWVNADGTVITASQNLGILFAEAGVWGKPQSLDDLADKLAAALVWSYGMNNAVVNDMRNKMPPPTLTLAKDGSGSLRFFSSYRAPGPGGAGGGPLDYAEIVVALSADHKATLTKTPRK